MAVVLLICETNVVYCYLAALCRDGANRRHKMVNVAALQRGLGRVPSLRQVNR